MTKQLHLTLFIFLITLEAIAACQFTMPPTTPRPPTATPPPTTEGEVNVPFVTIEQEDAGSGYISNDSQLFLIASADGITKFANWLNPDALAKLRQTDFQHDFVVALFRGVKPTSNYQTVIERITQKADQLIIYAQFWEPNAHMGAAPAHTSPYALVKIARNGIVPTQIKLVLQSYVLTPTS